MTRTHPLTPREQARSAASGTTRPRNPLAHQQLAAVVAVGAMVAAGLGLLLDGVYGSDEATVQMLRGFDAVTLLVIGPSLLLAVRSDRHGSTRGRLLAASLLAYLGYTFAYYLLGAGFTDLMLLHAPLFTATLVALVLAVRNLPTSSLTSHLARGGARVAAGVLGLLAVSLGAMWVYACIAWAVDATIPAGSALVESETVVHLGIVLDLTLLVPLYGAATVLLWRRRAWGFVLAALALVAGTLHQVSYLVALLFQYAAEVPGSVPMDSVEPVILLLYGVATALLLRRPDGVRPSDAGW
jgi:hypothetical protein